jgi:hypothetical protein
MTPITDTNNLPLLRLRVVQQFATHPHESHGGILNVVRTNIARELAEKIVREEKFFELTVENQYWTMRTDCIVLTQQEYADFAREKFKQGLQHAQGFMPQWEKP